LLLDASGFNLTNGAFGVMLSLQQALTTEAARRGISEAREFERDPLSKSLGGTLPALQMFMDYLPRSQPHFILVDETQNLFLLRNAADQLDSGAVPHMRRVFKVLAGSSPPHVVWVFTGSRMAIFWANLAQAPVNGYSLLTHVSALHLPPRVPASVKHWAWDAARAEFGARNIALPTLLYSLAPDHHATLLYFCAEWLRPPREADVASFCSLLRTTKIYPEVVGDLLLALAELSPERRRLFLDLMTPYKGVVSGLLPQSIRSFFAKSLQSVVGSENLVFVDSELVRVAVEAIVAPDGQLVADTGGDALVASMRLLEHLFVLTDFADLLKQQCDDGCVPELLNAMVARIGEDFWRDTSSSSWFNAVLNDELHAKARDDVEAARRGDRAVLTDADMMCMYLRLWRNSIIHAGKRPDGDAVRWAMLRAMPPQLVVFADDARLRECMTRLRLAGEQRRLDPPPRRRAPATEAITASQFARTAPAARGRAGVSMARRATFGVAPVLGRSACPPCSARRRVLRAALPRSVARICRV
jgi:hypothetical protein